MWHYYPLHVLFESEEVFKLSWGLYLPGLNGSAPLLLLEQLYGATTSKTRVNSRKCPAYASHHSGARILQKYAILYQTETRIFKSQTLD